MGKRSDGTFERNERDYYKTPMSCVLPLLPHLPEGSTFVEPCAGDGTLVRHLEGFGRKCTYACDIEPQDYSIFKRDMFDIKHVAADYVLSNPPWDRKILHPAIEHFRKLAPTWFLFDADWSHTAQAKPYLPFCRKIVSIGRVKWIEGSKHTGKDNACFYLFEATEGETVFYGR